MKPLPKTAALIGPATGQMRAARQSLSRTGGGGIRRFQTLIRICGHPFGASIFGATTDTA